MLTLVTLLRQRGRMSAPALAAELEVSVRTVLRDVEALSTAGVPVYAERGRTGGFALLPGVSTALSGVRGLTDEEAVALLAAGSPATSAALGLAPSLAGALGKVLAALPEARRSGALRAGARILVLTDGFLTDPRPEPALAVVQQAVLDARRLCLTYRSRTADSPSHRTVDPLGLISAGGSWYLLAVHRGEDRVYRLSRIVEARVLPAEAAHRIDAAGELPRRWQARRADFRRSRPAVHVLLRIDADGADRLAATGLPCRHEPGSDLYAVEFWDRAHASGVLWSLGADMEVVEPADLRTELVDRAARILDRHGRAAAPPLPTG
nr:WYL domain-containing protein [Nakamurella flavida]